MITFLIALGALIVGYLIYGKIIDNIFKPTDAPTPAITKADGVDFIALPTWKVFMIQLLNIAGLGPIFGALAGALWGPVVYIWIVCGTIFAGGVHDYLSGMISLREGGKSLPEIVGEYLGETTLMIMRIFLVILMILVGTVFTVGPAGLLKMLTGIDVTTLLLIILFYYFLATLLPIDKLIGRLYPIFGVCFIIMAIGIMGGMMFNSSVAMPEMQLSNLYPAEGADKLPIWPLMFITVACGAVSGFHATQSPMMARCLKSERLARPVFYGAMVCEGVIALIWAAAGITFYESTGGLAAALSANGPGAVVHAICEGFMGGGIGVVLAMIGVVVCPITTGDTALRCARLILADWLGMAQEKIKNRLVLALPIIVIAGIITQLDFNVIWRYFAWINQSLATIVLWTGAVYMYMMKPESKSYLFAMIPAIFMSIVTFTYILQAKEGLELSTMISYPAGIVFAAFCLILCLKTRMVGRHTVH